MKTSPLPAGIPVPLPRTLCLALLPVLLGACASLPDLGTAPGIKPLSHYDSAQSLPAAAGAWISDRWWQSYGDAQLDALMDEALQQSPDLAAARARVDSAAGQARQSQATELPSLSANASVDRLKQSYNTGLPVPTGLNNSARATLDFSYEFDFWGKNRAAIAASASELAAAQAEAAQARLTLSTALASSYAELARLFADRDASAQALEVRRHSETLLRERMQQGLETAGSVKQAESRRASAEADLLAAEQAIALQRNSLAALLGAGPDRGLRITRPAANPAAPRALPARLDSELLGRRPDLVAARLRAEAGAERIHVARAGFYPNINLGAYIGVQSLGLDMLTRAGSGMTSVAPAISLPIFRGGQLQGQYQVARADYDAAVASYDQTLSRALNEVADAVTRQRALDGQLQQRRLALAAAEDATRIMRNRYQGGLTNYLDVLSAEDNAINTRRALLLLDSQRFTLDVALIKALGGGYHNKPSATPTTPPQGN